MGIRSANYNHEVPGHSGVSGRAEAGSAGPSRRLGTLPRSGRGDSCLDGADALMAAPRGLSPHRCRCGCGHWSSACSCGAGATLLIDGWLRRPRGLSLYEHRAPSQRPYVADEAQTWLKNN